MNSAPMLKNFFVKSEISDRPDFADAFWMKFGATSPDKDALLTQFGELPPNAAFSHDVHILLAHLESLASSPEQNRNMIDAIKNMIQASIIPVMQFESKEMPWIGEYAFIENAKAAKKNPPLVLNFSANQNAPSLKEFQSWPFTEGTFEVWHIGLQLHSAGREYLETLAQMGHKVFLYDQINRDGLLETVAAPIREPRPVWIRFNSDCLRFFDGGGEAAWATGLELNRFFELLQWLGRKARIQGISLAPSVNYTSESLSTRTSAQILSELIFSFVYARRLQDLHKGQS